jgi:hypothetical protein
MVLLMQFLPVRECIGVSKFRNQDNYDALGAAHGPEVRCPFVLMSMKPPKPDFLPFGEGVIQSLSPFACDDPAAVQYTFSMTSFPSRLNW